MLTFADDSREALDDGDLYDTGGAQLSDRHAEQQLIGYLLSKPLAFTEVLEVVGSHDFFDPFHRRIFETLEKSYQTGDVVGVEMIVDALGGNPNAIIADDMTIGRYIAHLISHADMAVPPDEVAAHIFACSERRAVGTADDIDLDRGKPINSKFGGLRFEDIGATRPGARGYTWLVENIIPMGEITLGFGDTGSGKTFGIFDMGMAIARGQKWNGYNVQPGLVIYVAAEAGNGFSKRKMAYTIHHELEDDAPLPFYLCTKRPDFFSNDNDVEALMLEIVAVCETYRQPLTCIVLDTLSALAPGMNENASQDVSMVRARLVRLQERFGVAIILVHHKPKGGSTPRGHGSLTADFETTIEFEAVADRKSPHGERIHRATVRKQREGRAGIFWEFTLPVITVGRNQWGNVETSCVVEPFEMNRASAASGYRASPNELLFMHSLFEALAENGGPAPAGLPHSITKAVDIRFVREAMRLRAVDTHEDDEKAANRFRTAFHRCATALQRAGIIGFHKPLFWWTGKAVIGLSAGSEEFVKIGDDYGTLRKKT